MNNNIPLALTLLLIMCAAISLSVCADSVDEHVLGEWRYRESTVHYDTRMFIVFEEGGKAELTSKYTNFTDDTYRENVESYKWKFQDGRFYFIEESADQWGNGYLYLFNEDHTELTVKTASKDMVWKKAVVTQKDPSLFDVFADYDIYKIFGVLLILAVLTVVVFIVKAEIKREK